MNSSLLSPGECWDLERILQHVREQSPAWNGQGEGWDLLPLIGSDHPDRLLVDVLSTRDEALQGLMLSVEDHALNLDTLPDNEKREEMKWRREELQSAERWGKRCTPPWDAWRLEKILCEAARVRRHESLAAELGWYGVSAVELASQQTTPNWYVEDILLAGQPAVLGGPEKSLKTALSMDLAISLASGTPFLGRFAVPRKVPVHFFSGESGLPTLGSRAQHICSGRAIGLDQCRLRVTDKLPRLGSAEAREALRVFLRNYEGGVVIFDPAYLCLLEGAVGVNSASMFEMGRQLLLASTACLEAGCTPVFNHHFPKDVHEGMKPELRHLAYSGFAQFVRQWVLLNRRRAYQQDGRHELVMVTGGSSWHGGAWSVNVDEGLLNADGTGRGRGWSVELAGLLEAKEDRERLKSEEKEARSRKAGECILKAFENVKAVTGEPVPAAKVRQMVSMNSGTFTRGLAALKGELVEVPMVAIAGKGARKAAMGLKRVAPSSGPKEVVPMMSG